MHIMEGYLPVAHAIVWTVVALPPVVLSGRAIVRHARSSPRGKLEIAAAGAFTFLLSSFKLPSVTGSSSHATGTGLGALLVGPAVMPALGAIVLLFQALYEVTQDWSAFGWSKETGRRHSTILDWVRTYNERGPDALTFVEYVGGLINSATEAAARAWAGAQGPEAQAAGPVSWTRWTTPRIRTRIEAVFGRDVCKETVRRLLHGLGLSWKKAKKLLAKADPEQRRAFVTDIRALLDRVLHDENLVLGYGCSPRGGRLYAASSSPGLHAKVSFYGVYLYSESEVRIWEYPRANGEHTIEVLQRLRNEFAERPMIVVWDGAPWHRSACVLEAAARLAIEIVRLPAYSPDFMLVEALWRWLRESVTYNHCHDTAAELLARVAAFVATINRDACALADRLWVKDELDPEEEKLRFSA
jgi:transposase